VDWARALGRNVSARSTPRRLLPVWCVAPVRPNSGQTQIEAGNAAAGSGWRGQCLRLRSRTADVVERQTADLQGRLRVLRRLPGRVRRPPAQGRLDVAGRDRSGAGARSPHQARAAQPAGAVPQGDHPRIQDRRLRGARAKVRRGRSSSPAGELLARAIRGARGLCQWGHSHGHQAARPRVRSDQLAARRRCGRRADRAR
jgi:hypothetical protein